ncbi:13670_t:CDS:10 [Entrophospora sp. SA101]|nr:13670_t:CDS:10 [Entrophospora sp. SA101]
MQELLATVKKFFCDKFSEFIRDTSKIHDFTFDEDFDRILDNIETKDTQVQESKRSKPRKFEQTKKYKETLEGSKKLDVSDITKPPTNPIVDEDEIARNIEALNNKKTKGRGGRNKPKNNKSSNVLLSENDKPTRKKVIRVWDDKITKEQMESLDYSAEQNSDVDSTVVSKQFVDQNELGRHFNDGHYEVKDLGASSIFSFFKNITGQKTITEQDLAPALAIMKDHLIKKNVAADIAIHLCESVAKKIVGQKTTTFKSMQSVVKQSMEDSLKRILTPKTSVDLLRDIAQAQSESRPYTICFIGVNGVGKSTNLSKTCFWLLQNGLKVLIAACDTFRSGAVEQLRVHVRNLGALGSDSCVELYERGYGKDAAGIAKDAINYAKLNKFDVVLIDTAGRMQDNEPLMRALAKLVTVNNPDKIIFVGEALVGNEAVDQLTKFNQALKDFSGLQNPRHIDGIILTKFDTIDDKVGAALSMAYTTGQPILFVGTGQTYTDLKNMKVAHIVQVLLKD